MQTQEPARAGIGACEQSRGSRNATQTHSSQVLPFSTGVIGELLPVEKLEAEYRCDSDLSAANWGRASSDHDDRHRS